MQQCIFQSCEQSNPLNTLSLALALMFYTQNLCYRVGNNQVEVAIQSPK